jgi:hypothetical protein
MSKKMQTSEAHHEEVVKGFYDQMKPVLDSSEQPIFLYLDNNHKACNSKFARMLGYKTPQEWAEIPDFLEVYVAEKSREKLMTVYWDAMKKKVASTTQITWTKKGGENLDSTVILVPIFFQGHLFSLHFITNVRT